MGFPSHIVELLQKNIYAKQWAAVRTGYGLSDWFTIKKGVRQGYVLSPPIFNVYTEIIIRKALKGFVGTISVGGRT